MTGKNQMQWTVTGKRPSFNEENTDRLFAMVLALTSEVAVLRHRLDSMQTLAETDGWLSEGALEAFMPDLPDRKAREAWREAFLARVLYVMDEELADLQAGESQEGYWSKVADIETGDA